MDKTPMPSHQGSSCASCRHLSGTVNPDKSMSFNCTRYPPTPIGAAQVSATGQINWIINACFPPIGNPQAFTCGEHDLKGTIQ